LGAVDVAGWSPLHVAALMGRREVVVRLLQAGASPQQENNKLQLPIELCADNATYDALRSFEIHEKKCPDQPWEFCREEVFGQDVFGSRLQYDPFFVPREAVIKTQKYRKEHLRIGLAMFNQQPGYGIAFLVATGVTRDYPVELSTFLQSHKVDARQVGNFLGEAFSLAFPIRLELVNSVGLHNTGLILAMTRVFSMLQLPDDLQKIHRLVHDVARIWWRQHERMAKDDSQDDAANASHNKKVIEELRGHELKGCLSSSNVLQQLMFSIVMLHWHIHRDGNPLNKKKMDFSFWKQINQGIETGGADVPDRVQYPVFNIIEETFVPELAIVGSKVYSDGDAAAGGADGGMLVDEWSPDVAFERPSTPVLSSTVSLEGWAEIVGSGFPRPKGLAGVKNVTYRHMSSIFSEITNSSGVASGLASGPRSFSGAVSGAQVTNVDPSSHEKKDNFTWLSLSCKLLFFSDSPSTAAPFAFLDLQKVSIASIDIQERVLTLSRSREISTGVASVTNTPPSAANKKAITVVLLLPDGRWQEVSLVLLELRMPTLIELGSWRIHLSAAIDDIDFHASDTHSL